MLRDYWRVQPGSLSDEFRQVKGTMDPLTWEAIEAVRKNGAIGARMEQEGAEIQDAEPGEAKLLIGLIEMLIEDWLRGPGRAAEAAGRDPADRRRGRRAEAGRNA